VVVYLSHLLHLVFVKGCVLTQALFYCHWLDPVSSIGITVIGNLRFTELDYADDTAIGTVCPSKWSEILTTQLPRQCIHYDRTLRFKTLVTVRVYQPVTATPYSGYEEHCIEVTGCSTCLGSATDSSGRSGKRCECIEKCWEMAFPNSKRYVGW